MEKEKQFKFFVRKIRPTSQDGINRLNRSARINFKKEVYVPLKKVNIDLEKIYDEKSLAYFLMIKFGAGKYDALAWNSSTHRFGKSLFKVELYGSLDSKWGYDFISTRGISRRWWWLRE